LHSSRADPPARGKCAGQADHKAFPRGLPPEKKFKRLAKAEADAYFESQFPQEEA
jgi:hypothetical protein